jgi:hypothetical protein
VTRMRSSGESNDATVHVGWTRQSAVEVLRAAQPPGQCGWTRGQWQAYFDKRFRIAATTGRQSRPAAKAIALECCIVEWLDQHPEPSAPGRCAWCGKVESPGAVVLPFGTEPGTHTWLHRECWDAWHQRRRSEATAALAAMGIEAVTKRRAAGQEGKWSSQGRSCRTI